MSSAEVVAYMGRYNRKSVRYAASPDGTQRSKSQTVRRAQCCVDRIARYIRDHGSSMDAKMQKAADAEKARRKAERALEKVRKTKQAAIDAAVQRAEATLSAISALTCPFSPPRPCSRTPPSQPENTTPASSRSLFSPRCFSCTSTPTMAPKMRGWRPLSTTEAITVGVTMVGGR